MKKALKSLNLLAATLVLAATVGCGSKKVVEDHDYIPETTMTQQDDYSLGASSSGLGL